MKKIYVMAAFLGAGSLAFGQLQQAPQQISKNTEKATTNNYTTKAPGAVLWSDDFADPSNWVIAGDGNQGTWVIGVEADLPNPQYYSTITSASAANGFAFFEGVQYLLTPPVEMQNAWIEMATAVDLSAENVVTFKFDQSYRAFNSDFTYVEVSLDGGTTWEQTTDINPNTATNSSTTETVVYRNFNVNNSNNVKFRFRWNTTDDSDDYGAGYAWQVDDVAISSLSDFDLSTDTHVYGSENAGTVIPYFQIPLAQTAPIKAITTVTNQGSADQTNVVFTANETVNGTYTGTSSPKSIVAGASDSLVATTDFTPNAVGNYSISYTLSADDADDVPANNIYSTYAFTVTDNLYARDTSTVAEAGTYYGWLTGANASPEEPIEPGNIYDIFNTTDVTGIDFQIGDLAPEGAEVFGQIYDANLDPVAGGETQSYIIQSGDEGKYVTLVYETPLTLAPGEYVVTVQCFDTQFSVASAGSSAPQTSFVYYPNETTWYYTTSTPVVRMNFDPTLSVENNELANLNVSQNFPNPFANETTVLFNLKETANVSYTIVDLTGKVVANVNEGTTMAGEHEITIDGSSFANGVYYLNIVAGDSKVTRKMIVNK